MYKKLNITYDKDYFLYLFRDSKLNKSNQTFTQSLADLPNDEKVKDLLKWFPFVPNDAPSISLMQLRKEQLPYINENNNGAIIFPMAGNLHYSFYSYTAPVVNGRPSLSPNVQRTESEISEIKSTLIETVTIDQPIIFNGKLPHSYNHTGYVNPIYLLFKIPEYITWEDAVTSLNLQP
jgi:hypothetical protein